jgi:DNA-binding CsgD family transcriptional regulator
VLLCEGRIAQVEEVRDRTREMGRHVQAWDSEASYLLALSTLRWEQGRLGEIENAMRDALVQFPGYRIFRCFLALSDLECGRTAEATEAVDELLAGGEKSLPRDNEWLAAMTILAEVMSRLQMTGPAASMYEAMTPYAHLVGSAGGESVTGSMQRPLGQVAALLGRWDEARCHHEQALEVHRRMRAELWIAHSEFDLAGALQHRGELQQAEQLYARALHRCETLGMTALTDRIRAARGDSRTAVRPGGLTKREVEVAALVASGASNREIADALVISERTAESHVQNILTKLGVGTRAQIASWATTENLTSTT